MPLVALDMVAPCSFLYTRMVFRGAFMVQRGGPRTAARAGALAASIAAAARANALNQHFRSPWIVAVGALVRLLA